MEKRKLIEYRRPRTGELISFRTRPYYVTDTGQVWNEELKRYMAQWENRGYLVLNLRDDNCQQKNLLGVHDLVATCFIRLLDKGESCHHLNHDRHDNRLENLQIIDDKEHVRMHWQDGTMDGVKDKLRQFGLEANPPKQVAQLTIDGRLVRVWPSTHQAGRNGFDHGNVAACANGKQKTHKGYRWQYMSDYLAQHDKPVDTQPVQLEFNFQ